MIFSNVNCGLLTKYPIILLLVAQLSSKNIAVTGQRTKLPPTTDTFSRNYRIVAASVKCSHKVPHIIEFFHCYMTSRNNRTYTSGSLLLRQPIRRLAANVILDIYRPNGNRMNIFNVTVDCCAILASKKHGLKLFDNLLKIMYDTVNVVPTCPLKAHFNYTITDFDVDETILPAYIPKSSFRAGMYLHTKGFQTTSVLVEGRIVKAT